MDLYFLRRIVRPGGIVVPDDHWWPSVGTAARYFELNLGWRVVPGAFEAGTTDPETGRPRLRAFRLPDPRRTLLRGLPAMLTRPSPPPPLAPLPISCP